MRDERFRKIEAIVSESGNTFRCRIRNHLEEGSYTLISLSLFTYFLEQISGHGVRGEQLPFIILDGVKDLLIFGIESDT